ncbi:MAG: hypothetical protein KIS63_10170, partial [Caldilineales bacterium]|nr:hypothetical protein [Caldilineales bacterium]
HSGQLHKTNRGILGDGRQQARLTSSRFALALLYQGFKRISSYFLKQSLTRAALFPSNQSQKPFDEP